MHISQLIKQFNVVSNTELSFHLPNKYRLLGDYTFENKGSSIYWPFDDHCILVDSLSGEVTEIPLKIKETAFILVSTPKLRTKTSEEFNTERAEECRKALEIINKRKSIHSLTELSLADYREIEHYFPNPLLKKRAYHIVSEQYRVNEAVKAIRNDNHTMFGKLMKASNASFIEYYDFFDEEVKELFDLIKESNIIGYRLLSGYHFGNILCLVEQNMLDTFKKSLQEQDQEIEFEEIIQL